MVVHAFILGRLSSHRLPGKVLMPIAGQPLFDILLARLKRCTQVDQCILATSTDPSDDRLADHARLRDLPVFRGALDDVAGRLRDAIRAYPCDYFVRVNADSPLADPTLIDSGIRKAINSRLDLVTNLQPRTYPYGISLEVLASQYFTEACRAMSSPMQREHPTAYFYEHPDRCAYASIVRRDGNDSDMRLTVDEPADLPRLNAVVERLGSRWATAGWAEIVTCARAIMETEAVRPVTAGET